ncbi:hypothetical protein XENOCAPTIV_009270 [Xenoophorus captivus]|uniref:Amidohydrolase-related domain-containing protein n=1 Tax=Xenoophorus captivus TaxID=1517983 RepID=A0ABV0R3B3_9TELE
MSRNPAYLSSLGHLKGSLAPGFDADLVIWDPETGFQVFRVGLMGCNSSKANADMVLAALKDALKHCHRSKV